MKKQKKQAICQSCGMEMKKPEHFGTQEGGEPSREFCSFCYQEGLFTDPEATLTSMRDKVVNYAVKHHLLSKVEAIRLGDNILPTLKRWNRAA